MTEYGPEAVTRYRDLSRPSAGANRSPTAREGNVPPADLGSVEPRVTRPGSSSSALVHPPETNVQCQLYPVFAGGGDGPYNLTDPLATDSTPIIFRHTGWAHDRRRVYDALLRTHQPCARIHDFTECGKYAYVFQSVQDPEVYTLGGSTCHDRFCLPCGRERSRIIASNVKLKLDGKPARFLTLTLRSDTEPLHQLLAKLTRDFTSLRRTKLWQRRVTGGVAFLEVKWLAATNRWHVHLHALLQGRYVPREELSKLWLKITGTSDVIDIRIVQDEAHCTHYICKYASKPLDRTVVVVPLRLDQAIVALKGKRLCLTFGSWRGYKLTEPPESGTWVQLGTLEEIITQAEDGNLQAQTALTALRVEYAPSTRAPPPNAVPTVSSLTFAQHCLDFGPQATKLPDAYGSRLGPRSN